MPQHISDPLAVWPLAIAAMMIVVGVISVISPATGWWLSHGWEFRNAEPSYTALVVTRVGGVALILAGAYFGFRHL